MQFNIFNNIFMTTIGAQMVAGQSSSICSKLRTGKLEKCTITLSKFGKQNIDQLKSKLAEAKCPGFKENTRFDEKAGKVATNLPKGAVELFQQDPSFSKSIDSAEC